VVLGAENLYEAVVLVEVVRQDSMDVVRQDSMDVVRQDSMDVVRQDLPRSAQRFRTTGLNLKVS
jgi:hypothetical protein